MLFINISPFIKKWLQVLVGMGWGGGDWVFYIWNQPYRQLPRFTLWDHFNRYFGQCSNTWISCPKIWMTVCTDWPRNTKWGAHCVVNNNKISNEKHQTNFPRFIGLHLVPKALVAPKDLNKYQKSRIWLRNNSPKLFSFYSSVYTFHL